MDHDWHELAWDAAKYGAGAAGALAIKWAWDKTKKFYGVVAEFLYYFSKESTKAGWDQSDKPDGMTRFEVNYAMRFFSRKPQAIALHKFSYEITTGRFFRKVVGKEQAFYQRGGETAEVLVPPEEWVVIFLYCRVDEIERLRNATIWSKAETVEGKKYQWKIASFDNQIHICAD